MENRYLTESEVSKLTSISLATLRNHRSLRRGFSYIKIGKSVRYSLKDIVEHLEKNKVMVANN